MVAFDISIGASLGILVFLPPRWRENQLGQSSEGCWGVSSCMFFVRYLYARDSLLHAQHVCMRATVPGKCEHVFLRGGTLASCSRAVELARTQERTGA